MTPAPSPPPWSDDPLSKFMADADFNARAAVVNYPDLYALLQRAHGLLKRIVDSLEKDPADPHLGVPRMLILRSHSAVLGAMRLAMSGQGNEAQPLLRVAIENAWYALHVASDPAPPSRAKIWWKRGDDEQATQTAKDEFTVGNVRRTHEGLDAATAAGMKSIYDSTIDFGAHPNQAGVAASLEIDRATNTAAVGILHAGIPLMVAALQEAVVVSVLIAKTVRLIYQERFQILDVDGEIDGLVRDSSGNVFRKYV